MFNCSVLHCSFRLSPRHRRQHCREESGSPGSEHRAGRRQAGGSAASPRPTTARLQLGRCSLGMAAAGGGGGGRACFVLGASGETGQALLRELLARQLFARVTLVGRRRLNLGEETGAAVVRRDRGPEGAGGAGVGQGGHADPRPPCRSRWWWTSSG